MFGRLAEYLQLHRNILLVLAGVWLTLLLGTLVRWVATSFQPRERREQRLASLETWWVLWFLFSTAVLLGRAGGVLFFAAASYLGLREFLRLAVLDPQERRQFAPAYCRGPAALRRGLRGLARDRLVAAPPGFPAGVPSAVCLAGRPGGLHVPRGSGLLGRDAHRLLPLSCSAAAGPLRRPAIR